MKLSPISPPDDWTWMVMSFFIFANVINNQFLVNPALFSRCLRFTERQVARKVKEKSEPDVIIFLFLLLLLQLKSLATCHFFMKRKLRNIKTTSKVVLYKKVLFSVLSKEIKVLFLIFWTLWIFFTCSFYLFCRKQL